MSQEQKFVSLSADELDRDIDDLIGLAGHLSEIQHWAAQAGSKHLAKLAKKLLDAKNAAAPTQEPQAEQQQNSVLNECLSSNGPEGCNRVRCQLGKECVANIDNPPPLHPISWDQVQPYATDWLVTEGDGQFSGDKDKVLNFVRGILADFSEQPQEAQDVPWAEAQRICDLPAVDEAIRNLLEDQTGDNATCMVRNILRAAASKGEQAEPVLKAWVVCDPYIIGDNIVDSFDTEQEANDFIERMTAKDDGGYAGCLVLEREEALRTYGKHSRFSRTTAPVQPQQHDKKPARIFTYENQPGNVEAWRFGEACSKTRDKPAGDYIDTGLQLLLELQNKGYGIVAIEGYEK